MSPHGAGPEEVRGMNIRGKLVLVAPALGLLLAACYEKPQTVFFEPGEYKGRTDPLLKLEASPEQQQRLEERLNLGQRDR
jgi:hypothetical protein